MVDSNSTSGVNVDMNGYPDQSDITVAQAWDAERPVLQEMLSPFDGFHETEHAVTGTCLISFDRNKYSVMAKAARRAVARPNSWR